MDVSTQTIGKFYAERVQDIVRRLAVRIDKDDEFVRGIGDLLIPGGLDELLCHLHVKRSVSRWNPDRIDANVLRLQMLEKMRKRTPFCFTRGNHNDVFRHAF